MNFPKIMTNKEMKSFEKELALSGAMTLRHARAAELVYTKDTWAHRLGFTKRKAFVLDDAGAIYKRTFLWKWKRIALVETPKELDYFRHIDDVYEAFQEATRQILRGAD